MTLIRKTNYRQTLFFRVTNCFGLIILCTSFISAQLPESDQDPSGIAIPYPFVHLIHSDSQELVGTSAYLRAYDPFLFYQLGKDLVQRQFTSSQGIRGNTGSLNVSLYLGKPVQVSKHGLDARFAREHTNSCGACHSIPFREPGGGQTIASTSSNGRNTPHFFGAGLVEMIGEQIRAKIFNQYDTNRNGQIDLEEISPGAEVQIIPSPGAEAIDFGTLSPDKYGIPQLNPAFRLWYLNQNAQIIPNATSLRDTGVVAFDFAFQPFGWGRGWQLLEDGRRVAQGGDASTIREFFTTAADLHMGLQAHDPTQLPTEFNAHLSNEHGGVLGTSLNGALQYAFGGSIDRGDLLSSTGISLDDPDGDRCLSELTEGDIDAVEYYLLHTFPPAYLSGESSQKGRFLFNQIGCNNCHVENWKIEAKDTALGYSGDRRFFHQTTETFMNEQGVYQLQGRLVSSYRKDQSGALVPVFDSCLVQKIYSDFKHWDIGPGFYERRYDGSLQREHRTAPLWGVGSTAPYGHAGNYLSLDEVIRAHGGAASKEQEAYSALTNKDRKLILDFLNALVLYQTEDIPCDINADGFIDSNFMVHQQNVGYERFDSRFLFASKPKIKMLLEATDHKGRNKPLYLINNLKEIYGLELYYRRDSDEDSFPDVIDPFPRQKGIIDDED